MSKQKKITFGHVAVVVVLIAAALFYPFAYRDFGITSLAYALKLFTVPTLALLMLALVFCQADKFARIFRENPLPGVLAAIFTGICLLHFFMYPEYTLFDLSLALAWIIIPLFGWMHAKILKRWLPYVMSLLVIVTYIISFIAQFYSGTARNYHYHYTGLPGNWNWNAALLTACTPVLIYLVYTRTKKNYGLKPALAAAAFPLVFSLLILSECASRGQLLALAAAAGVIVFCQVSLKLKKLLAGGVVAAAVIITILLLTAGKSRLDNFIASDVRIPIWKGTAYLALDNAALGTGMARFESEYASYQPVEYFLRKNATERTDHPHNHFLFIAACFGLGGFIVWFLLMVFPLANLFTAFRELSTVMKLYGFAFLVLLFHSMLDLILFKWPTNLLALLILGIFWFQTWPYANAPAPKPELPVLTWFTRLCGIFLLAVCLSMIYRDLLASVFLRNSLLIGGTPERAGIAGYFQEKSLRHRKTPRNVYKTVMNSHFYLQNPDLTLKYLRLFEDLSQKSYAHSNAFTAFVLRQKQRYREALPYLIRDCRNYPLSTRNWYELSQVLLAMGRKHEALGAQKKMLDSVRAKGFNTEEQFRLLVQNPEYDMHPHLLKKYLNDRANSQHD